MADAHQPRKCVFVVDDHEDGRELLAEYLRMTNYDVECFDSAEAAWAQFESGHIPDCVISDLSLGSMSGPELARNIRGRVNGARLPIVLMTGNGLYADSEQLFDAILVKPVHLAALLGELKRLTAV